MAETMQKNESDATIYVALLNEGTECWRPVAAHPEDDDTFTIVERKDDEEETWEFNCGDRVRCVPKILAANEGHHTVLIAVSRA